MVDVNKDSIKTKMVDIYEFAVISIDIVLRINFICVISDFNGQQLSIMIIYNMVDFNPMDQGYDCHMTIWPSKYKIKRTSCLW